MKTVDWTFVNFIFNGNQVKLSKVELVMLIDCFIEASEGG